MPYANWVGMFDSALLAGAGVGAVGDGDLVLGGLVGVGSLLGGHSNTAILGSLDTNGLSLRNQVRTLYWDALRCVASIDMV
jgi:hypothetical protein